MATATATATKKPANDFEAYRESVRDGVEPSDDLLFAVGLTPVDCETDREVWRRRCEAAKTIADTPRLRAELAASAPPARPTPDRLVDGMTLGELKQALLMLDRNVVTLDELNHRERARTIGSAEAQARDYLRATASERLKTEEIEIRHAINRHKSLISERHAKVARDAKRRAELRVEIPKLMEARGAQGWKQAVYKARMEYARLCRSETSDGTQPADAKDQRAIADLELALAKNDEAKMVPAAMRWTSDASGKVERIEGEE